MLQILSLYKSVLISVAFFFSLCASLVRTLTLFFVCEHSLSLFSEILRVCTERTVLLLCSCRAAQALGHT